MVAPEVAKRVLSAVVAAYPEHAGTITGIEITQGPSNAIQVDICHAAHTHANRSLELDQLDILRSAVSDALQPWRHTVRTIEIIR